MLRRDDEMKGRPGRPGTKGSGLWSKTLPSQLVESKDLRMFLLLERNRRQKLLQMQFRGGTVCPKLNLAVVHTVLALEGYSSHGPSSVASESWVVPVWSLSLWDEAVAVKPGLCRRCHEV